MRGIAVLLIAGFILALIFVSFPDTSKSLIDFSHYYCAAVLVREGHGHSLYDLQTQAACLGMLGPVTVFYNHPPFEALLYIPLSYLGFRTAYVTWTLIAVTLLVLASLIIERDMHVSGALTRLSRIPIDYGLVFIIFLTFAPTTTCLLLGQDSTLMLLVYTITFILLKRGHHFLAGCVLACGLFKFNLVLPFTVILLLRRQWALLKGLTLIGGLLVVLSVVISGWRVLISYPKFLFFDSLYQQIGGFAPDFMPNVRGISFLLSGRHLHGPVLAGFVAITSLLILWIAARSWRDVELDLSFAAAVLATILASYHIYDYDLMLILLPACIIVARISSSGMALVNSKLLLASLGIVFIPPVHRILLLNGLYALMAVPIICALFITTRRLERPPA